ncbi:hypothetical protein C0039_03910 [Pseudohalioglobus lutimaris]|uniref:Tetratricopeptide repeat-containing protein n=1 Tax=Pseudohalioglobus lutimaris TaxID=1737061 RepID=A0A2N5X7A5_9GAMM|nr:hypothetical protein C0039_03910 [Pseudohalioglobus lutimaris]
MLLLLALLTVALYSPGLSGPFLFDDGPALTSNPYLNGEGSAFEDWRTATFSSKSGPLQRPIAMWSFAVNSVVAGGIDTFQVKLVNLVIHLLCGGLVYLLALGILRQVVPGGSESSRQQVALLAAALWLLAPLHVSTVLYAVQRMAQLATLFTLLGLWLFVRRREQWAERGASPADLIATSLWLLLVLLLAVLSKENGVLLLWLLPVFEVTLFRGRWAGSKNRIITLLGWIGLLVPLLVIVGTTLLVPELIPDRYTGREFSLQERLLTQLRLLWQYLSWLVFPDITSMGFQHDDIPLSTSWVNPVTTLFSALAWLVTAGVAWLLRRRLPLLGFALLFYLVGHALESSVWPLEMVYEHRNYLPSVGLFILLAYLLQMAFHCQHWVRPAIPVFAVLAILSTVLFLRVQVWSEHLRLTAVNVDNHPESSRSHYFLAEAWLKAYKSSLAAQQADEGRGQYLVAARHHFELMYQKNPRDFAAIVMLYYLDSHHFRDLRQYNDWFAVLREVAGDRPLQASDIAALDVLLDCFVARLCDAPKSELFALMDTLERRYIDDVRFLLLRYRYLRATAAPPEHRLALLERARRLQPGNTVVYQHQLTEFSESGNLSGLYEAIRSWMLYDDGRQNLQFMRGLFAAPAADIEQVSGK